MHSVSQAHPTAQPSRQGTAPLRKAAQDLEVAFLSEMLKSAGLHKTSAAFGGGAGEEQFQSMLIRAQAEEIAKSGGVGLAESLYHALKDHTDDI